MFQKIKSEIKTEAIPWIRQHWLFLIILTIFAFSQPLILGIIFLYGSVATVEVEMLKAMIEAEATILGFFALVVVYALSSLDNRIDRLELLLHILIFDREKFPDLGGIEQTILTERLSKINERKRKTIYSAVYNGVLLIGSLLASILGLGFLGIPNQEWAFYMCSLSAMLFFVGIGLILLMIYDLAQSPETVRKKGGKLKG